VDGIGAGGALAVGIVFLSEPAAAARLVFATVAGTGTAGLKPGAQASVRGGRAGRSSLLTGGG